MAADEDANREQLPLRLGRYAKADVDRVLSTLAGENARLKDERDELLGRVAALDEELDGFRKIEQALFDSVVTGQRAAVDVLEEAEEEKQSIIEAARQTAEGIVKEAQAEHARLGEEIERLRSAES